VNPVYLSLEGFSRTCRRVGVLPTQWLLVAVIQDQALYLLKRFQCSSGGAKRWNWRLLERYRMSSSRFGIGQEEGSNRTPLGLHRIAEKIGGGYPPGTVFKGRVPVGWTWQGIPDAAIANRILWLEGLESGVNQGAGVDTHSRYIYIHGVGDEATLGRPASRGCIHLAAMDLIPLYDRIPSGTLVWVVER
jgi:lipoprotein-anchoring transpeptidase ErfK/SrfK